MADGKAAEVALTTYEVSIEVPMTDGESSWRPVAVADGRGARGALAAFAESMGDSLEAGSYRLVPKSNISVYPVGVETKRAVSIGNKR